MARPPPNLLARPAPGGPSLPDNLTTTNAPKVGANGRSMANERTDYEQHRKSFNEEANPVDGRIAVHKSDLREFSSVRRARDRTPRRNQRRPWFAASLPVSGKGRQTKSVNISTRRPRTTTLSFREPVKRIANTEPPSKEGVRFGSPIRLGHTPNKNTANMFANIFARGVRCHV